MKEQIKEALEKATQGNWIARQKFANQCSIEVEKEGFIPLSIARVSNTILEVGTHNIFVKENARLIANAPTWLRWQNERIEKLEKALEEVKSLIPNMQDTEESPSNIHNMGNFIMHKIDQALKEGESK